MKDNVVPPWSTDSQPWTRLTHPHHPLLHHHLSPPFLAACHNISLPPLTPSPSFFQLPLPYLPPFLPHQTSKHISWLTTWKKELNLKRIDLAERACFDMLCWQECFQPIHAVKYQHPPKQNLRHTQLLMATRRRVISVITASYSSYTPFVSLPFFLSLSMSVHLSLSFSFTSSLFLTLPPPPSSYS